MRFACPRGAGYVRRLLLRWIIFVLWRPFEAFCRWFPLVPLRAVVSEPVEGVKCIKIYNSVTWVLGWVGGYGYSICYLVDGELLVDTGFPWAARRFRRLLSDIDARECLTAVVCTHAHEDHCGNNDVVAELTSAKIMAHRDAIPEVRFPSPKAWYRRFLFGAARPVDVHSLPKRLKTRFREFEVLDLPGHCPGHIGLFECAQRWLFSGDLFVSADLDSQLNDASGPVWVESIEKALEKEPSVLFDGHGQIVVGRDQVRTILEAKLAFLRALQREVEAQVQRGPATIEEVTRAVFGRQSVTDKLSFSEGRLAILTGADFSRSHLVKSFVHAAVSRNIAKSAVNS